MRPSLAQAAVLLISSSSAAVIRSASSSDFSAKDITTVAGTTGSDQALIRFQAPCLGCFIGTDNRLELTLEVGSAEEECVDNRLHLNGVSLPLTSTNKVAKGHVTFKSKPTNGLPEKEIHAFWESTCLKGEASLLSVRFDDINGDDHFKAISGFTTSFKQKGQPTFLRLSDGPTEHIDAKEICNSWLEPDASQRLAIAPLPETKHTVDELIDIEFKKFDELLSNLVNAHDEVRATEKTIISLVKEEFRSCSTMSCWWNTAKSKMPVVCKMIASHWTHHKTRIMGCADGDACDAQEQLLSPPEKGQQATDSIVSETPKQDEKVHAETTRTVSTPDPTPTSILEETSHKESPDSEPPNPEPAHPPSEEPPKNEPSEPPHGRPHGHHGPPPGFKPHDGDGPPPGHHGPPPWFKPGDGNGPPGHHGPPPWFKPHDGDGPPPGHHGPPPWFKPHDGDGPPPGHHGPPPWFKPGHHGPPPPFESPDGPPPPPPPHGPMGGRPGFSPFGMDGFRHRFDYRLALAVISFILLIIIGCVLFKLVRMFRDPRRRAECAAWREERQTKRLYRKAACKHRWNTWWSRCRSMRSSEYEEKRESLLAQETRAENILQRQLRSLRDATDLVRKLVAVEEGRVQQTEIQPSPHATIAPQYHQPMFPAPGNGLEMASSSHDAHLLPTHPPLYLPPPPRYEAEIDGEITVVDGFTYTPSNSGYTPSNSDDATESSIVDCSPRLSFETGRSTLDTKDASGN